MKIGMLAPLDIRVPPVDYGGTELVVSLLTEELIKQGHEVTLFASGDSITEGKLVSVTTEYLRKTEKCSPFLSMLNVVTCYEKAVEFDIIHNHTSFEGMTLAGFVDTPILTTFHNGILHPEWIPVFMKYKHWYNTVSRAAKLSLPPKGNYAGLVYNAINPFSYKFNPGKRSNFLLYLSRFSPEKGPHRAIRVARKLGIPLILAGNLHPKDVPFFEKSVKPFIDGKNIINEGEISDRRKKELLAEARCLLAPIKWPEPFGLFMVEAMASGTPVVSLNYGSAAEVVWHGHTGFVVDSEQEMVSAVRNIDSIDPWSCRRHVLDNFDLPVLVGNYLRVYKQIVSKRPTKAIEQEQPIPLL